ncbi:glycosyltransferase [Crateriforma conspicua]|nr:glycosyltransferase [Crateriforma conspicua]
MTYLGQMAQRDLPNTMLDGLILARKQGLDAHMNVIGCIDSRASGRLARHRIENDQRLNECVTMTGWVSERELARQLKASDCFVLLRRDEVQTRACLPTRIPDYLQSAKPLILSGVGDLKHFFTHRQTAWILPPGDHPESLAAAMIHLATNPEEASQIGTSGARTCATEFCLRRHGVAVAEFLESLCKMPSRPSTTMETVE